MMTYTFQIGETISIALDAASGDPSIVSAVTAKLKKATAASVVPDRSEPVAATFSVADRAADGSIPAGWTLTIDAATSATLQPGIYAVNAALVTAGGTIITDPLFLKLENSTT